MSHVSGYTLCEYRLAAHYFLPDPAALSFDHWPEEEQWQLVQRPASLEAFEAQSELGPGFFAFGLEQLSQRAAVVACERELTLALRLSDNRTVHTRCLFWLRLERKGGYTLSTPLAQFGARAHCSASKEQSEHCTRALQPRCTASAAGCAAVCGRRRQASTCCW